MKKNIPLLLFCIFLTKSALQPITFAESSVLLVLAAMSCYFEFKSNDSKVSQLEKNIVSIQNNLDARGKELDTLKSSVASVKLASGIRGMSGTAQR
jgi:peptidoglycan hydrolase CwlO-like protein